MTPLAQLPFAFAVGIRLSLDKVGEDCTFVLLIRFLRTRTFTNYNRFIYCFVLFEMPSPLIALG